MGDVAAPRWDLATHAMLRQMVMGRDGVTEEQADATLRGMWEAAAVALPGGGIQPPDPPPGSPRHSSPARSIVDPPIPQKESLFPDFDDDAVVPDRAPLTPLKFATDKIKNAEYVEMWYFTTEGCREASVATLTSSDDTIGLLKTDSGLALQQVKASKASRNALPDEKLSWDQISTARHNLIEAMVTNGWPERLVVALAQLYLNLENLKATGKDPRSLIRYHAVVRRMWHTWLKSRVGQFNVGLINETLLKGMEDEIRDLDLLDLRKQASHLFFSGDTACKKLTQPPFLFAHCPFSLSYHVTQLPASSSLPTYHPLSSSQRTSSHRAPHLAMYLISPRTSPRPADSKPPSQRRHAYGVLCTCGDPLPCAGRGTKPWKRDPSHGQR